MEVYLDNAATTPVDSDVLQAMLPYFTEKFANANSQHHFARPCAEALDKARKQVAVALGCASNEVYFTGSGSEANTWAIKGTAFAQEHKGKHVIISAIEHPSVMNSGAWLTSHGFEVTKVPVDAKGFVTPETLKKVLRKDTVLVSVMLANNEIGTIQPIKELAKIVHDNGTLMHTDCVQAMGAIEVNVKDLGVDFATISAHKFYGPKGIGALYIRNGVRIDKLIAGGGQERSMRGGTSNIPLIVGMGYAIEKAIREREETGKKLVELRDMFIKRVEEEIPYTHLNGDRVKRLPNNVNFSFEFVEGESILMTLDFAGIAVSSGSACSSGSLDPSHVLLAIGVPIEIAHGSIRFSLGKHTTAEELNYTVDKLKETINKLRAMSPLFKLNTGDVKNV